MKASLMAVLQDDPNWADALPLVMMGMRASFKADLGRSAAELVFGEALRLPGQFFDKTTDVPQSQFAKNLQRVVASLRPAQTAWHQSASGRPVFMSPHMRTATHVFVRVDAHRSPLQPPYKGPYKILERGPKSFLLETEGGPDAVSVYRLKPAFLLAHDLEADRHGRSPLPTSSGRMIRRPTRGQTENLGGGGVVTS
uniref:Reverse transcriptase/retrotransposon-derived protein RNase H-like domain-containing protein n=1 Tax=Trichuris muris TaxID=70415 RepID=A0A5S6R0D6_TRIMR